MSRGFRNTFVANVRQPITNDGFYDSSEEEEEHFQPNPKIIIPVRVHVRTNRYSNVSGSLEPFMFSTSPLNSGEVENNERKRYPSQLLSNERFLEVSASEGKRLLKKQGIGSFLLRPSSSNSCFCTLMVNTENNGVLNVQIVKLDGQFCLYSKNSVSDEKFATLAALLDWYKRNEMPCSVEGIYLRDNSSVERRGVFSVNH